MTTSSDIPQAQPVDNQAKAPANLYTEKTELEKLQDDLKYMTGKGNILEVEEKIQALKEKISNSPESKIIEAENEKNFEMAMSFNEEQKKSMSNLNDFLKSQVGKLDIEDVKVSDSIKAEYGTAEDSDLNAKKDFDNFVKEYRTNRRKLSGDLDDNRFLKLDNLVLNYEKSFGINSEPLVDQARKETRSLDRQRQEAIRFVKGKMDYLALLKKNLTEAEARAKISILGRKDTSETGPIEKQILSMQSDIAQGIVDAASDYLGLNVEKSDIGL